MIKDDDDEEEEGAEEEPEDPCAYFLNVYPTHTNPFSISNLCIMYYVDLCLVYFTSEPSIIVFSAQWSISDSDLVISTSGDSKSRKGIHHIRMRFYCATLCGQGTKKTNNNFLTFTDARTDGRTYLHTSQRIIATLSWLTKLHMNGQLTRIWLWDTRVLSVQLLTLDTEQTRDMCSI